MTTVTRTETFEILHCASCGIAFGITRDFEQRRRGDLKSFFCPAGHSQWFPGETDAVGDAQLSPEPFDFAAHLQRQREFSERTFGPGARAKGVVAHIRKELLEIEAAPDDLAEWIDVVILALDGAWRTGATPEKIICALVAKQAKNEARTWPDWRTMSADAAIEHDRSRKLPANSVARDLT